MHEQAASLVLFPSVRPFVRPLFSPPFLSRAAAAAAWVVGTAVLSQNSRIRSHSSTKRRRRRKGKRVHIITGVAARYFEPLFSPADGMVLDGRGWFLKQRGGEEAESCQ